MNTLHWIGLIVAHVTYASNCSVVSSREREAGQRATHLSGVFVTGAESDHNINSPLPNDPEGILDSDIPIVPSPDNIHLFVIGSTAGRFSSFIPGWGHYNSPVLRSIDGAMASQHNREIYGGLLGLDAAELERLEASGVI